MQTVPILLAIALVLGLFGPAHAAEPELVSELTEGPGNLTVTNDGRIVLSLHQFFSPELRVVELLDSGELRPFPNETWNRPETDASRRLDSVLGIQADPNGVVWMLDNGMRSGIEPKLVGWDTRGDSLHQIISLAPPVTHPNSFVNDLAVDAKRGLVYIADPAGGSNAALIVVDLEKATAHRILEGHVSVVPEPIDLVIDGQPVERKLPDGRTVRPHVGVNPIALDPLGYWLYYGPMHGKTMYRVRTADLLEERLSLEELESRVEAYADKPICDGIAIDKRGRIYLGDLAANAIGVITAKRQYKTIFSGPRLSWIDAFDIGPDGKIYTLANQLHRTAFLNKGQDSVERPFRLFRFDPYAGP